MTGREERGQALAAKGDITQSGDTWLVPSASVEKKTYVVRPNPDKPYCSCPDFESLGGAKAFRCKHLVAVEVLHQRTLFEDGTETITQRVTVTATVQRKTYTQNWRAYNEAQTTEKRRFQVLLADLCRGIPEPVRKGTGRKPIPLADQLFAVCYKVYSTISTRRFNCDLQDATAAGHLSRTLHCNKVCCFFENADLTPHLHTLLSRSALPLRVIETEFAVDSSGFSVSKFVKWFDHKYGAERTSHDWVKVHVACGVKTHCITAAAIYDRDAADCPILPELVKATAQNFTVKEVSADKAYLSAENVEAIVGVGGEAFIAPKSNTTGGIGGLFEDMFLYYKYKQAKFMDHYHKRSNVESVFSAVKRKFGDHVRSRTPAAMVNESLAKLVCQNITAVIMSQCELGIEAEFWPNDKSESPAPAILPFTRV